MDVTTPGEEYAGPATLEVAGTEHEVQVLLRGAFQPIDGRFHWYGRVAATDSLAEVRPGVSAVVRTPRGSAETKLTDRDPWGRFRLTGTGHPPF